MFKATRMFAAVALLALALVSLPLLTSNVTAQTPTAVTITKTDSPDPVTAGNNLTYTFTVTNTDVGGADAQFTDVLPPQVTFQSLTTPGGWSCTTPAVNANGTVSCSALNIGTTPYVFTLVVKVLPSTPAGTISNTVNLTSEASGRPGTSSATATTTVGTRANVDITKTGPTSVTPGQNVTYTITLTNPGPSDAANEQLTDTLPPDTTFVSLIAPAGWSCTTPAVGGTGAVTCTKASFAANTNAVFTLVVKLNPSNQGGGFLFNQAQFDQSTGNSNENCCADTTATITAPSADMSISKTDTPDPVVPGANITYTVTLSNSGPSTVTSPTINDTVPTGTTFVSLTSPGGYTCTTPAVGGTGAIQCSGTTLASGANAVFTLVVNVNANAANGSTITNTATLDSTTPDPNTLNDSATATTQVVRVADLAVTKTASPNPTAIGANTTYAMTVTNIGPQAATGVTLSDTLPTNTTFVSLSSPAGWTCTTPAVGAAGTVSCTNPLVANGAVGNFSLVVKIGAGATNGSTIVNNVTVQPDSQTTDTAPGNNFASAQVVVGAPLDLAITKTDAPDPVQAGSNLTYTITVSNAGPQAAPGVRMSDTLPANTTFVSLAAPAGWECTTPAVGATGSVVCITISMPVSPAAVFTLVVKVDPLASDGSTISNTATVAFVTIATSNASAPLQTDDPNPANNTATATTTVGNGADLSVTKTAAPSAPQPGTNVTYTLTLTNNGPLAAQNVSLSDPLPAGTTFVSATQTAGPAFTFTTPAVGSGGTVTITAPSLTSGTTATFSIVVKLPLTGSGTATNIATVTSTTNDPNLVNNSAAATVNPGTLRADVAVTKTGTPDVVISGRDITYTLTVTNLGGEDALNVTLLDALPGNVAFIAWAQVSGPIFTCTTPALGGTGAVSCNIAGLAPRASAVFSLTVRALNVAPGPSIVNTATVSTTSIDTNPANNTASVTTSGPPPVIPQAQQNPNALAIVSRPPRTPTPQAVSPALAQPAVLQPGTLPVITPPRTGDAGLLATSED